MALPSLTIHTPPAATIVTTPVDPSPPAALPIAHVVTTPVELSPPIATAVDPTAPPPAYSTVYPHGHSYPLLAAPSAPPSAPLPAHEQPRDLDSTPSLSSTDVHPPINFRAPPCRNYAYAIPVPLNDVYRLILQSQLEPLKRYVGNCNPQPEFPIVGFDPMAIDDHPIHKELKALCAQFLTSRQNMPLLIRLRQCETAVAEIVSSLNSQSSELLPVLAHLPKFEQIEIAARNHLFMGLLSQQKGFIEAFFKQYRYFPDDLGTMESTLTAFVTKDGFYASPQGDLTPLLYDTKHLDDLISACVQQGRDISQNDRLIKREMARLHLTAPSKASSYFEFWVRDHLTQKMISKQVEYWRGQFHAHGAIDSEEMNAVSRELSDFNTANGKFSPGLTWEGNVAPAVMGPKAQLMIGTFGLDLDARRSLEDQTPFDAVKEKIIKDGESQLESVTASHQPRRGLFALFMRAPTVTREARLQEISNRVAQQQDTLLWAEAEWGALFAIPYAMAAPAPQEETGNTLAVLEEEPDAIPLDLATPKALPSAPTMEAVLAAPASFPMPLVPVPPLPRRITANDLDLPLVSWINLAYGHVMNRPTALENWQALPEIARHDALRHAMYYSTCQGKAEDIARELFKTVDVMQRELPKRPNYHAIQTGVSPEFVRIGESLLRTYYPRTIPSSFDREFPTLPRENRFYRYVYELAKEAGVHIEDWDREFGAYNWNKMGMVHISVQAIERCLHSDV